MDTTFPSSRSMYRAITSPILLEAKSAMATTISVLEIRRAIDLSL
nr:DUF2165 domain-containing protein [Cupriavidus taiwanensis]